MCLGFRPIAEVEQSLNLLSSVRPGGTGGAPGHPLRAQHVGVRTHA